jgi:hypothetical protein
VTESERYVLDFIKRWVWSGFYSTEQVESMIEDVLEHDCDAEMLRNCIAPEIELKLVAEAAWPATTDCDKLDRAFRELHEQGICALGNAGYTMSDGYSEISEATGNAPLHHYKSYCFYHGQDIERATEGGGIMIAFGALNDDPVASVVVGKAVCERLRREGFEVEWNGSFETRINLPKFVWQRRTDA